MLDEIVSVLACPDCGEGMALDAGALRCGNGHSFDVARQGYANLLTGGVRAGTADTADMVEARERFLGAGHFAAVELEVARIAGGLLRDGPPGCVVDVGAGIGRYLAAVLDQEPGRVGLALDISKFAARRAARAHPRIGAVVCDAWRPLPVRTGSAALVLDVFAPRNAPEFARVLHPDGALTIVTPTSRHLRELVGPLGMLTVDVRKDERLSTTLADRFVADGASTVAFEMALEHQDVTALVGMGPSSRHGSPAALAAAIGALPEPVSVTAEVTVSVFRVRPASGG